MVQAILAISDFISRYRRRVLIVGLSKVVLLFASSALLLVLVAPFAPWPGLLLSILLFCLMGTGFFFLLLPHRRLRPRSIQLAREVANRLGDDRLELVSAVQLATQPQHAGTSPELIQAFLDKIATNLVGIEPTSLICRRGLRQSTYILCFLLCMTVLSWVFWPQTYFGGLKALWTPALLNQPEEQNVPSWIGDIQLQYRYPAYAGRQDRVVEGTDGAIVALPGTEVTLRAKSDHDINQGALLLDGSKLPIQVEDGTNLETKLVVMKTGAYRFDLQSQDGKHWRSQRGHPIKTEKDRVPSVQLKKPNRDLVVRERDVVDILLDAKDDFGLEEVRLVWRSNGQNAGKRVLRRVGSERVVRHNYRWQLAELDLQAGEQVQFYIEATDNDSISGPKVGRSATVTLKVFSAHEHHRELMGQVNQLWERQLSSLGDQLEQDPTVIRSSDRQARLPKILTGIKQLSSSMNDVIGQLYQDDLVFGPLVEALENIHHDLKRHVDQFGLALRSGSVQTLRALHNRSIRRFERDVLYLEDLLDLERLEDLDQIAKQLDATQRKLAQLMERYKREPKKEIRKQIEAQIAKLKEQMARLLARQSEVIKSLRDEYLNPEALARLMSDRNTMSALDRVQALMMEGKLDQAMAELERIRNQIKQFKQAIGDSKSAYGQQRYQKLAPEIMQAQAKLEQLVGQQQKLMQRTETYRQKVIQRLKNLAEKNLDHLFRKLGERLDALVKRMTQIDTSQLDRFAQQEVIRILEQAQTLSKLFEILDMARSLETAEKLAMATDRLRSTVRMLSIGGGRKMHSIREKVTKSADDAIWIYRELKKIFPSSSKLLKRAEREQLKGLQQQQNLLRQDLSQLRSKLRQLNEQVPLFGPGAQSSLDRSGRSMRKASDALGEKDPRNAYPHQQAALSELQQMNEAMKKSCKGGSGGTGLPLPFNRNGFGRSGGRFGSRGHNTEKVEIPGEEDYEPPEEFRKELLEGMKDPVPEDYQPQVRKYYEELVK